MARYLKCSTIELIRRARPPFPKLVIKLFAIENNKQDGALPGKEKQVCLNFYDLSRHENLQFLRRPFSISYTRISLLLSDVRFF